MTDDSAKQLAEMIAKQAAKLDARCIQLEARCAALTAFAAAVVLTHPQRDILETRWIDKLAPTLDLFQSLNPDGQRMATTLMAYVTIQE